MSANLGIAIYYLVVWGGARIRGAFRRWRQPVLRGPEWFFNIRVQDGFYSGAGAKVLRNYRIRMLMSFAIEAPAAAALFLGGHVPYLMLLMAAMAAVIHVGHVFSVDLAERQASPYAVAEAKQPVPALLLSLKTRRLRDYSNWKLEAAMVLASVGAVAWLSRYYLGAPEHPSLLHVFGVPLLLLYSQIGFLLAKLVVVEWRTPIPQVEAEEHLEAREEARKLYLKVCDVARIIYVATLLGWSVLLTTSRSSLERFDTLWLGAAIVLGIPLVIWQEIRRAKVLKVSLRAHPFRLPNLMGPDAPPNWPLCYQPSAPMMVMKGAHGYSLNLGNTLAQFSAAYLAGFALLMVVLRMAR